MLSNQFYHHSDFPDQVSQSKFTLKINKNKLPPIKSCHFNNNCIYIISNTQLKSFYWPVDAFWGLLLFSMHLTCFVSFDDRVETNSRQRCFQPFQSKGIIFIFHYLSIHAHFFAFIPSFISKHSIIYSMPFSFFKRSLPSINKLQSFWCVKHL